MSGLLIRILLFTNVLGADVREKLTLALVQNELLSGEVVQVGLEA